MCCELAFCKIINSYWWVSQEWHSLLRSAVSAGAGTCPVALAELWRESLEYPLWGCGIPLDSLSPLFSEVVKGHWGTGTGQWSQGTPSVTDSERYLMPNVYEILE